jgi:hypothetical protein|nr:MAG TPA: hypothetical protein [Caudoviricetes sp.]
MSTLSFETLEYIKIFLDIVLGALLGAGIHFLLTKYVDKVYNVYDEDGNIKLLLIVLPSCFIVLLLWGIVTWMR